jgi:hypothetical protein
MLNIYSSKRQKGFALSQIILIVSLLAVVSAAAWGLLNTTLGGSNRAVNAISNGELLQQAMTTLATEATLDQDGLPLPIAGTSIITGLTGSESPTGGWQIPATSNAAKRDGYGSYIGYCVWNHGSNTAGAGYFTGIAANITSTYIALISAGKDKKFQTNCTQAKSGIANGDDSVRFITFGAGQQFRNGSSAWLDPVDCFNISTPTVDVLGNAVNCAISASRIDLINTIGLPSGTMVLAKKSGTIYQWFGGIWSMVGGSAGGYNSTGFKNVSFTAINSVAPITAFQSNSVQITGIGNAILVSVTNGAYSISDDNVTWSGWQSGVGSISNGQYIKLQQISSASFSTTATTTLNIGGITQAWNVTTRAPITTPNAFSFTAVTGAGFSAFTSSNIITITGIDIPVIISATGDSGTNPLCNVNGAGWTSCTGVIGNGNTLQVGLSSSASMLTTTNIYLTVGTGSPVTFAVTTQSKTYVDDVFSAYTYTGTRAAQTITNGINLASNGGMIWTKIRSAPVSGGSANNAIYDSVNGWNSTQNLLETNTTSAGLNASGSSGITPSTTGYSMGTDSAWSHINYELLPYVSWTFRKSPKFFDVVKWTGTGVARTIPHSLGITPGMIIIKEITAPSNWIVYHRSFASAQYTSYLNSISVPSAQSSVFNSTAPTSSVFTVGADLAVNDIGQTYVAYVFAHDASVDGLIQCGSFTTNGSGNATVTLGWEPQYLLAKSVTSAQQWYVADTARGLDSNLVSTLLLPNVSNAETTGNYAKINATGFSTAGGSFSASTTYIYIAIRRPNKPPTSGTQVYNAISMAGTGAASIVTGVGFAPDLVISKIRNFSGANAVVDKLRGRGVGLSTQLSNSEVTSSAGSSLASFDMDGIRIGPDNGYSFNASGGTYINHFFKRAPGFMDVVTWTGVTSLNQRVPHSLGVIPEMMIVKSRSSNGTSWEVYHSFNPSFQTPISTSISSSGSSSGHSIWGTSPPTTTDFGVDMWWLGLTASDNMVAYLFASMPGISKIGTYTGSASDVTIDAGFTSSARFILIKRTDATGNWVVFDSVRGIVNGSNDPQLLLNSSVAETTSNSVEPTTTGFIVKTGIVDTNVAGGTYIYMAIQ